MKRVQWWVEYILLAAWGVKLRLLPLSWVRQVGRVLGLLGWWLVPFRRKVCAENLRKAFPQIDPEVIAPLSRKVFAHFGRWTAELFYLPRMKREDLEREISVTGWENLDRAYQRGKGVIFVSGHLGNWEWLGAISSQKGYRVAYVVEAQANPLIENLLDRMRTSQGVKIIPRKEAVRGVLKSLYEGYIVAMLCDQDAGGAGVWTPFFGHFASTPRGPATFHLKTGAPIVFGYNVFSEGKYQGVFEKPLSFETSGDRERAEEAIMRKITLRLEEVIRHYPDQYLWFHRRWKTPFSEKPPSEPALKPTQTASR
ncbi:MAG: lysophospholipid acyltransferase family protein [bacterium]